MPLKSTITMNQSTAIAVAMMKTVQNEIMNDEIKMEELRGNLPNNNGKWGLPMIVFGHPIIVAGDPMDEADFSNLPSYLQPST